MRNVMFIILSLSLMSVANAQMTVTGDHGPGNSIGYDDAYDQGFNEGFLSLDFTATTSSFSLGFSQGYVCSSEPAFSKAPVLGYGRTKGLAEANAINNCIQETGNHRMHCDDTRCEALSFNSSRPSINLSVVNGQVGIRFSVGANNICYSDAAFGKGVFIAEAPTRTEAKVYAQRLCMGQTGNARMHCDVDRCESLGTTGIVNSGGINISGVNVEDIFGSSLSKEERIAKLEKEIEVIKLKLDNPDISKGKKRRLKRQLSRKQEQLIDLKAS